jgi:hypothetical protein
MPDIYQLAMIIDPLDTHWKGGVWHWLYHSKTKTKNQLLGQACL